MARVNPAYIGAQAGHRIKVLLEKYARWIPGNDDGAESRLACGRDRANAYAQKRKWGCSHMRTAPFCLVGAIGLESKQRGKAEERRRSLT